jgi:peptide/nickel transport system permease protein
MTNNVFSGRGEKLEDYNTISVENKKSIRKGVSLKYIKKIVGNKLSVAGMIIIVGLIFMAVFADWITAYDPSEQILKDAELLPGSNGHWLGTDHFGRDLWTRIAYGARISLLVGILVVTFSLIGGITLGLIAGYYKSLDNFIMRILDLFFAFPSILLAMLIIAILGTSITNIIIAISIWQIPTCARIVRGSVLSVKHKDYITSMKSVGASDLRILLKHILPNCLAPIVVFATMRMATAILATASLSYLGLGAQPPTPEWGSMIADGQQYMFTLPHLVIIPGIAIMLAVFSFNVVGDALRDFLDPNMTQL